VTDSEAGTDELSVAPTDEGTEAGTDELSVAPTEEGTEVGTDKVAVTPTELGTEVAGPVTTAVEVALDRGALERTVEEAV